MSFLTFLCQSSFFVFFLAGFLQWGVFFYKLRFIYLYCPIPKSFTSNIRSIFLNWLIVKSFIKKSRFELLHRLFIKSFISKTTFKFLDRLMIKFNFKRRNRFSRIFFRQKAFLFLQFLRFSWFYLAGGSYGFHILEWIL